MKDLMSWLESNSGEIFYARGRKMYYSAYNYAIMRVKKDDNFDLLFCQKNWQGERDDIHLATNEPFKYAGIYCKKDKKIYDSQSELMEVVDDPAELLEQGRENLQKRMQQNVQSKVEAVINNDRRNLQVSEISDGYLKGRLDRARDYGANGEARRIFLEAGVLSSVNADAIL